MRNAPFVAGGGVENTTWDRKGGERSILCSSRYGPQSLLQIRFVAQCSHTTIVLTRSPAKTALSKTDRTANDGTIVETGHRRSERR